MKEEDIRKREVFNNYLKLVEDDVKSFFNFESFIEINCPACGYDEFIFEFNKIGFHYVSCKKCSTLFINPRPSFDVLKKFYSESPSTTYWINKFYKPVAEKRREKIFRPRAEYVCGFLREKHNLVVGDVGAGFGLFLEELRKISPANSYVAIEPSADMAQICAEKGFNVKCMCLEDIESMEESFDLLIAFELFEHLFDPFSFLKKIFSLLKHGGYFLLTTLNGLGFDIQVLWEKSKSVSPPHHINFFNPLSIKDLLNKTGFDVVEITTPGKLDWDIVEGMIINENIDCGRFMSYLAKKGNVKSKIELQRWISRNNLSSHMRILARKPENTEEAR